MNKKYLTIEWDSGKTMTFNNANDLRNYLSLIEHIERTNAEITAGTKDGNTIRLDSIGATISFK